MNSLSPVTRRVIAVLLLVLVLALPWQLVIRPIIQAFHTKTEEITDQQLVVRRLQAQIVARPMLEQRLADMQDERGADGEAYLSGDNDALAAAQLQARVRQVIDTHGATLTSTQILDASDVEGFRKLAVSVRMSAQIEALQRILYDLETGSPVLFIDTLDVVSPPTSAMPDRTPATLPPLSISLNVSGFLPPGRPAS